MMRKVTILALLLIWVYATYGQKQKTFIFMNKLADTTGIEIDYALAKSNFLGPDVARKTYIVKKTYTYVEKGTPTSPGDKTVVLKPTIYYSLQKLNKYYKKEIRKGNIEESVAIERYKDILDKAFSIFNQDTDDFEAYLKSIKDTKDIEETFYNIILD
jgi:hypothetical protein